MADRAESENPGSPAETTTGPARLLFISYASHDAEVAQKVCSALEAAGFPCWMAPRDVKPGAQYADAIVRAINEAQAVVLVLSASAVTSSHVGREVERAASKHKPIIAFRIDAAPLAPALEYFLSESQWIDVVKLGMQTGLAKLAEAVGSAPRHPLDAIAPAKLVERGGGRRKLIAAAAAVVGVGMAIGLGLHFWTSISGRAPAPGVASSGARESDAVQISDKSIAVLPFADMSEKKDQQYFADGMAEEILDVLAKIPRLTVISRTSSFQFKGRDVDAKMIGSTLGTRYIVEGSVRKSGVRVRITAQLIDTRDGSHRWSETYDRGIGDAFKLQDEIAASLVRALELAVGAGDMPARLSPKSAASYDLYLRGRQAFDRYDRDGFEQAADLYRQALERDPEFAPAASGLANVQLFMAQWGHLAPKVGYEGARQAAERAMKLDPHLAGPHQILAGVALQYDWDWPSARHEIDLAFALDPRDPAVWSFRGLLSLTLGHPDDATSDFNSALRLDPLSPNILFTRGWGLFWSGRLPEAEASFRKALQISPTYESAHFYLGHILVARGDLAEALAEMDRELDSESRLAGVASVQFALGHKRESDAALAQLTKLAADDWASGIAGVHAIRNEPDAAFEWLDRAYTQKDEDLYIIKGSPLFRNVARDPRYAAFLRKMKLPE